MWVVLGIVFGFYIDVAPSLLLIAIMILLIALFWARKKQQRDGFPFFEMLTSLLTFCLGVWIVGISMGWKTPRQIILNDLGQEKVWHLKVREVLKPNLFSHRYVVQVVASDDNTSIKKILINLSSDSIVERLMVDDEFLTHAKFQPITPPLNPHQFDYRDYLKKQGITYQIRTNYNSIIKKENAPKTLFGRAANFREQIISKLKKYNFGPEEIGVIQALLLGKRDDISENTYDNYKNAGAVHILAVSGLHVGILLFLLEFMFSPLERLPKGKTLKLLIIVLLLWSFAFVAGLSPSIVRAVSMFSFVAYAIYLNRPTNSFNIIALSMLFILLVKPLFLFQVGFQMSYAAVFSIVWIYPKLQKFWFPESILVRKIWQLLSVSVAAQLGVLPISLFYFHQFPALFFVSNLLIIPFLGLILGFGILVIFLALIDFLPKVMVQSFDWTINLMNSTVAWVARQESFIIKNIPFDSFQLIWGYLAIIVLVLFLSKPKWKTMVLFFSGLIIFQVWGIYKQSKAHQKESIILAHRSRNTILLHQLGDSLAIITSDPFHLGNITTDYAVAERIQKMDTVQLKNSYQIGQKKLFVVDSLTLFPIKVRPDYLLLTQSSKINLERVLDSIRPKKVFADGSNYPNLVNKWKATCAQKEIPFHHTGEKGFYMFKF